MTVKDIVKPVEYHLKEFETYFKDQMRSKVSLLDLIIQYITRKKGKQIRPAMVFLTADMCGEINKRTYIAAAMVELLHTATLIHDDVVDKSTQRRGIASINSEWNNKIAILTGDYLLAKGLLTAIENDEFNFLKALSTTVKRMSEGELLQIQKSKEINTNEEIYFKIISDKTASLLSTCCEVGALSVTDDELIRQKMKLFGEYVGISFQIKDDILDYISKSGIIGKPVGNDIKEKKITLPLLHSLQQVSKGEQNEMTKLLKNDKITRKDIAKLVDFVHKHNGIEYADKVARKYSEKAFELLNDFPDSTAKEALKNITNFVIEREL